MNEWLIGSLIVAIPVVATIVGFVVYRWEKKQAADAIKEEQRLRSEAERSRDESERAREQAERDINAAVEEKSRLKGNYEVLEKQKNSTEGELKRVQNEKEELIGKLGSAQAEVEAKTDALNSIRKQYEDFIQEAQKTFENIARRVLDDSKQSFIKDGTTPLSDLVKGLNNLVNDLKDNISTSNEKSAGKFSALESNIKSLIQQTDSVTKEANNLACAIRGEAQRMGEWGEIQLLRVLEASGLEKSVGFSYQETFFDNETGRKSKRTDVVVRLPNERTLIIDSKATISSVEKFQTACDEATRTQAENDIVDSVRRHVDEIKKAKYQDSVPNAFPIVLMYIPLEEVYLIGMKAEITVDGSRELLREYARRNNVVFVNSTCLIPVLHLVAMMWDNERARKNQQEIIRAAEELLNRVVAFGEHFVSVGDALHAAQEDYEAAKRLIQKEPQGQNIANAVKRLRALGVKHKSRRGKEGELSNKVVELYDVASEDCDADSESGNAAKDATVTPTLPQT